MKLLIAAVADADVTVWHSIFSSLHGNVGFDDFQAQADSLSAIFAALNDEALVAKPYKGTGANANSGIISGVLVTVGDLARVLTCARAGKWTGYLSSQIGCPDPYLITDAGTISPFEHGEVFVLDDGGEVGFGR